MNHLPPDDRCRKTIVLSLFRTASSIACCDRFVIVWAIIAMKQQGAIVDSGFCAAVNSGIGFQHSDEVLKPQGKNHLMRQDTKTRMKGATTDILPKIQD